MRKPRKGSRPSAVDPSPPPILEVGYAAKTRRVCFWCREKPAAQLVFPSGLPVAPTFCSRQCAAAFGVDQVYQLELTWCERHGEWSEPGGACKACKADAGGRPAVAASSVDKLARKESEVANG